MLQNNSFGVRFKQNDSKHQPPKNFAIAHAQFHANHSRYQAKNFCHSSRMNWLKMTQTHKTNTNNSMKQQPEKISP